MKNEVDKLHETLGKFTKGKEILYLIFLNQWNSYNKNRLRYQPNKFIISIFHDRKKSNLHMFKYKYFNKLGHLETLCYPKFHDLRWSKGNIPRPLKILKHMDPNIFGYQR